MSAHSAMSNTVNPLYEGSLMTKWLRRVPQAWNISVHDPEVSGLNLIGLNFKVPSLSIKVGLEAQMLELSTGTGQCGQLKEILLNNSC